MHSDNSSIKDYIPALYALLTVNDSMVMSAKIELMHYLKQEAES